MLFLALVDFITAPLFLMVEAMPEWNLGLLIFTLAEWVYRHIPNVFGTGPGGG